MSESVHADLDAVAEELVARGLTEQGDFFVVGRPNLQVGSSEYVGLEQVDDGFDVFYFDMGRRRSLLSTTQFDQARARFVEESLTMGRQRGRRVVDPGEADATSPHGEAAAEGVRQTLALAAAAGADLDLVVAGNTIDRVPDAPSHRWLIFPTTGGQLVVGGMDRGSFSAYSVMNGPEAAAQVLTRWAAPELPAPPRPREVLRSASLEMRAQLGELEQIYQTVEHGGSLTGRMLPVGTPLDHIGNASGHVLCLYGEPFSARSLPPTDLAEDRMGLLLNEPLPDTCTISRTGPWFGQRGGGHMVVLDRVIGYYIDIGTLAPFAVATDGPAPGHAGRAN